MSDVVSVTIPATGEILDFPADSREAIVESLLMVKAHIDAFEKLKKDLNAIANEMIDRDGPIEHKGYRLNYSVVQRKVYDPAILREVFDEDLLATFSEYKKTAIDAYIAEHLDELGEDSTRLRETMIESGKPYAVTKLERLTR